MQRAPSCIGVVMPGAVDDHRIVLLGQRADAGWQAAAIAVACGNRAQTNGLEGLILQPGGIWWVEAGHGGGNSQGRQVGGDLANAFHRAAAAGVEGADEAKQFQEEGRSATNKKVRLQGKPKALRPLSTVLATASTALTPRQARARSRPFSPGEAPMFS
jgi:hypothetical protein